MDPEKIRQFQRAVELVQNAPTAAGGEGREPNNEQKLRVRSACTRSFGEGGGEGDVHAG